MNHSYEGGFQWSKYELYVPYLCANADDIRTHLYYLLIEISNVEQKCVHNIITNIVFELLVFSDKNNNNHDYDCRYSCVRKHIYIFDSTWKAIVFNSIPNVISFLCLATTSWIRYILVFQNMIKSIQVLSVYRDIRKFICVNLV